MDTRTADTTTRPDGRALQSPRARLLQAALIVIPLVWAGVDAWSIPLTFDDAYMVLRYAENLARGHGIAWNPTGEQTYGMTSLPWLGLVAAARPVWTGAASTLLRVLTGACALAAAALMVEGVRRNARWPPLQDRLVVGSVVVPLLCAPPLLRIHVSTGMDTMLALAVVALMTLVSLEAARAPGRAIDALLAAAAWLCVATRPDLGFVATVPPMVLLWPDKPRLVRFLVTSGVAVGCWLLLLQGWFGDPLPLPVYAKSRGYYDDYAGAAIWSPIRQLVVFGTNVAPWVLLMVGTASRATARRAVALLLPVILTELALLQMVQIMGANARFSTPLVPLLVVAGMLALDDRLAEGRWPTRPRLRLGIAAAYLAMMAAAWASQEHVARTALRLGPDPRGPALVGENRLAAMDWWRTLQELGRLMAELPPGTRVAMTEHGIAGAMAPDVIIDDMAGLHDPELAHHGFSAARLLRREPDLIVLPHKHYRGQRHALAEDPIFARDYVVFAEAFNMGFAVRRGSPHRRAIRQAVEAAWERNYKGLDLRTYRLDL